ncbi:hypothetical protein [Flavobacterium terrisoli]|uniref:hypothetical protein n=1 Tax=Flavobacterium terrisoli TaxID=3242195 RepID=UPI002542DCCA|nr:hypothetical protein [Flavobacterium buctense]
MKLSNITINCQQPADGRNISRTYKIVECEIETKSEEFQVLLKKANELANLVNSGAANDSSLSRHAGRKANDAIMGVLSEEAWLQYINSKFGNIASYTNLTDIAAQIDLRLTNGEKLEIRSSYVRNGVQFALCNNTYNFKNLGPYSNTIKPGEVQKDFYLCVLFDVDKDKLLNAPLIKFYLIGGSTWKMMLDIGYNDALTPMDALVPVKSTYKVIKLKDALDVSQVLEDISKRGYTIQT